jgi:hypothetical protein
VKGNRPRHDSRTTVRQDHRAPTDPVGKLAIHWVFPDLKGRDTLLDRARLRLGRDEVADCHLPGDLTSRRHAEIVKGAIWIVRDLDSTNGVFVNGVKVHERPLRAGDVLRIGEWVGVLFEGDVVAEIDGRCSEITAGYFGGPTLRRAMEPARRGARSDLPIVVEGQTGTGKEGAARAIHAWSGRPGAFVAMNCAAMPETLAEAELFGHRKGAFTGADQARDGYFRAAHRGTLFLDEVVEMPLSLQAKLLRALEQREVVPLGQTLPIAVDVRIVVAAQGPLEAAVAEKKFRTDLLGRLRALSVKLPALADRREDVPFLFCKAFSDGDKWVMPPLDPLFVEALCLYSWPLNVRELVLLARSMRVLHGHESMLTTNHLPEGVRPRVAQVEDKGSSVDLEIDRFKAALEGNGGNIARAATAAGVSRPRAYRLMAATPQVDWESIRRAALSRRDEPQGADEDDT